MRLLKQKETQGKVEKFMLSIICVIYKKKKLLLRFSSSLEAKENKQANLRHCEGLQSFIFFQLHVIF